MKVQVMRMLLLNNMKFMLRNELLKRIIVCNFFLLSNVLSFILLIIFCIIVNWLLWLLFEDEAVCNSCLIFHEIHDLLVGGGGGGSSLSIAMMTCMR